jgi:hypothetical protein
MSVKFTAELDHNQVSILTHQFFMSPEMTSTVAISSVPTAGSPFLTVTLEAIDDGTVLKHSMEHGQLRSQHWHKFFKRQ